MKRAAILSALLLVSLGVSQVPRSQCFPIETLPSGLQPKAEHLLLKLLDSEALFTVVGGIKPTSSGWVSAQIKVDAPNLQGIQEIQRIVSTFRCGNQIESALQPFWRVYDDRRYLDGFIFNRESVAQAFQNDPTFWGFYGITALSHPLQALGALEVDATPRRNRGYGYLFGYPRHAVDFFVESEEQYRVTKKMVPRDFFSIPVQSGAEHHFVYAVPRGYVPREPDIELRNRCAPVLAYYLKLRGKYLAPGGRGVVALIRDWFDDGKGNCSSLTAYRKALVFSKAH